MSQAVEPLLNASLLKHVVCDITVSIRCCLIKIEITYSHSSKKFSI